MTIEKKINNNFEIDYLELDELYWYIGKKANNIVYVITIVSRSPRQIVGFDVAFDKSPKRIQQIVDNSLEAKYYCTDGYAGYIDIVYPGKHIYNPYNKNDTFTVESINSDLRHYIPTLARRSKCFSRKLETLKIVLEVFVNAYNRFGLAKYQYKLKNENKEFPLGLVDFL